MRNDVKFAVTAAFACGFLALAPKPASAMPGARLGVDVAPAVEKAYAVRVCNRWGRCWWTYAGGYRGYYGRPYAWRGYGWRHPYYHGWHGYGWRRGWGGHYGGWHHGWRGGWHGGWHGGHGRWR